MDLLICFRPEPDPEQLSADAWLSGDGPARLAFLQPGWNCFDESALALAAALTETAPAALHALALGDGSCTPFLQTLNALGFASAARLDIPEFHPEAAAAAIAAYVKAHSCSILLMGQQRLGDDGGALPLLTAEALGWPCITGVTDLISEQGRLYVTGETDGSLLRQAVDNPCVLAVGNAVRTVLPVPTFRSRMTLGRRPVPVCTAEELGLTAPPEPHLRLLSLRPTDTARRAVSIQAEAAAQAAAILSERYLRRREELP